MRLRIAVLLACIIAAASANSESTATRVKQRNRILEGIVVDASTAQPIPRATIRVLRSGRSTMANDDGRYRLLLPPGHWELSVSHVTHHTQIVNISLSDSSHVQDIKLIPLVIVLSGTTVYSRDYNAGQEIILKAIQRKQEILKRLNDYQYEAYSKFLVNDLSKEGVESILLIAESQTTAYWEYPDQYKEIITSRRQTANLDAEGNLVTVGEILNFNKNRIDIGKYTLVTPTAEDAFDSYEYYLIDTIITNGKAVFRLEIEPKTQTAPLFYGYIDIVDSTYDVVSVEVGFNEAVRFEFIDSLTYHQQFADFGDDIWMPVEIRLSGQVHFGMKLPGIPKDLSFSHSASLYSFLYDQGIPAGMFDDYVLEVDQDADEIDSVTWDERQTIPLSKLELAAFDRMDSLENVPPSPGKRALQVGGGLLLMAMAYSDVYHFNRVEGSYFGLGSTIGGPLFGTKLRDLRFKLGYSEAQSDWQYQLGTSYQFSEKHRLVLSGSLEEMIVRRASITTTDRYNPTALALAYQIDPFDYFYQRGFNLTLTIKPIKRTTFRLMLEHYQQLSVARQTDYSLFGRDTSKVRGNAQINDGDMRSLSAAISFDSRKRYKNKGRDGMFRATQYLKLTLGGEVSSPDLFDSDFDYRKLFISLTRRQRTLGLGVTELNVYAGISDRSVPFQKQFVVDHNTGGLFHRNSFNSLGEEKFTGDRAATVYLNHDFDQLLFRKSKLPLISDLPFSLSLHGGLFWTEFREQSNQTANDEFMTASRPYSEIGFGLGNLTPFITPLNLALWGTWQLSDYDTERFRLQLGLKL